ASFRLIILAEFDAALAFADDRKIFRLARLEQLRDARQSAGDIAGFRRFTGNTREHVAGFDMRTVFHRQDRIDRHHLTSLQLIGECEPLALFVAYRDPRPQIAAPWLLLPVDDYLRGDAGRLVDGLAHR